MPRCGDRFGRIDDNPYNVPDIHGVQLDFDIVRDRRWARLESARTDVTEARPGDEITIETVVRPYRGEGLVRQIPIHIPTSTSKGSLRILVSDGETLDRIRRASPMLARKLDLASTIALINKQHVNNRVYVSLLEADPEAMVADKVMPTLPLSVMNVMDGMRGTQDMVVLGESAHIVERTVGLGNIAALAITAVNPEKDIDERTVIAALAVIEAALARVTSDE